MTEKVNKKSAIFDVDGNRSNLVCVHMGQEQLLEGGGTFYSSYGSWDLSCLYCNGYPWICRIPSC